MTLRVVAWNSSTQRLVRTDKDPANIGGGIVEVDIVEAGSVALTNGTKSITITYNTAFYSADAYALIVNLTNTTDISVQYQPVIVTSKTTTDFTAIWNVPLDSGNYNIDYIAVVPFLSFKANVEGISSGVDSYVASLLSASTYATIPQIVNEVDTTPIILHPINVTDKDTTQFTSMWNRNTDTANYDLHWIATLTSTSNLKSGSTTISNGATSITVPLSFPSLISSSYALIPRMSNILDSTSIYQPITITAKSLSSFTAKWNQPVDSVNYKLDWILKTF